MIEGSQAPLQCLVYVLGNVVMIALAMYKCHSMGLLPTYASDWLAFVDQPLHQQPVPGAAFPGDQLININIAEDHGYRSPGLATSHRYNWCPIMVGAV
ncbi:hypothetical protein AHF37_09708 [Paragonimus kellicotti]|nr:hypothetical protein AHF37_09708 [Paragonimus kellicotti]